MKRRAFVLRALAILDVAALQAACKSSSQTTSWARSTTSAALTSDVRTPEEFGAVGDGVVDDTTAIQTALDHAASDGGRVIGGRKTYRITSLIIRNGVREFDFSQSVLKSSGKTAGTLTTGGVLNLDGSNYLHGRAVRNLFFRATIDVSDGDPIAVFADQAFDCTFSDCRIYGFADHPVKNHYAFVFAAPSARNVISRNIVKLVPTPRQRGFGVAFYGTPAMEYGGFFNGTIVSPKAPCNQNVIELNHVYNGSYGVCIEYSSNNTISRNVMQNQNHRSIYLAGSEYNTVSENQCLDYLSSAVVLGYGSRHNRVFRNECITAKMGGEAAMNINTGSSDNLIDDNHIDSATNFGVYIGGDSSRNVVHANTIFHSYLAGVTVENDFVKPRPAHAIFTRPNYAPPPPPNDRWSRVGAFDNVITNNTFGAGHFGRKIACISVNQLNGPGATRTSGTIISGNRVIDGTNIAYGVYLYADDETRHTGTRIFSNSFSPGIANGAFNRMGVSSIDRMTHHADRTKR